MKAFFRCLFAFALTLLCLFALSCAKDTPTNSSTESSGDEAPSNTVSVDILETGKSDCIVINTGSKIIMIDTGEQKNFEDIDAYMKRNGYDKVDMLILTHYDKDHIGSAVAVITAYDVETVIESSFTSDSKFYVAYHNLLSEKGLAPIKLTENYTFTADGCDFEIDIPKKPKYHIDQDNNSSLIISMKFGEKRFLFCADALEIRIAEYIDDFPGVYDFVKLPHHGTCLINYRLFLDEVRPTYAAITCSEKKPSSDETLALMDMYDIDAYETRYGEINVTTDGNEIHVTQNKEG